MDGGYHRSTLHAVERQISEVGTSDHRLGKPADSSRQQPARSARGTARKGSIRKGEDCQAALWPKTDADVLAVYSVMNRRRSLIRRLDHLLEDATNEQFHEASIVLRDALEGLRLALLKDTQLP